MSSRNFRRSARTGHTPPGYAPLCAETGPDDGLDPRFDHRRENGPVANRKALQLCSQVERALNLALGGCGDDVLRELIVVSVRPAPSSARLLVTVTAEPGMSPTPAEAILDHLHRAGGLLRTEVAAEINRRRAPELMFVVADRPRAGG